MLRCSFLGSRAAFRTDATHVSIQTTDHRPGILGSSCLVAIIAIASQAVIAILFDILVLEYQFELRWGAPILVEIHVLEYRNIVVEGLVEHGGQFLDLPRSASLFGNRFRIQAMMQCTISLLAEGTKTRPRSSRETKRLRRHFHLL